MFVLFALKLEYRAAPRSVLYKTVLFFFALLLNSAFSAQIFVQGETVFTVSQGAYVYADSIKFSKKTQSQKSLIVQKGKIFTAKAESSAPESYASVKQSSQKQPVAKREKTSPNKATSYKNAVAASGKTNPLLPKFHPYLPTHTTNISTFSKKNAVVSGGSTSSSKLYEAGISAAYTSYDFYWCDVFQRFFECYSFNNKNLAVSALKVRPPPLA